MNNRFEFNSIGNLISESNIGAPIIPGQDPPIAISRTSCPPQSIPAGKLGHHILTVITAFWGSRNNFAYHITLECRGDHFRDMLTLIVPSPNTQAVTPKNLAWGLNRIAINTFHTESWRALKFDWAYARAPMGTVEISLSPPSFGTSNASRLRVNVESVGNGTHSAYGAPARTRFTGTRTTAEEFLSLYQKLMAAIWALEADDPVWETFPEGGCLTVDLADPSDSLKVDLCMEDPSRSHEMIIWRDITDRLLIALQLPAYLDRWETVHSDFYEESGPKIASINMYRGETVIHE